MPISLPNWFAFSRLLAHDLHLSAWLTGTAVAVGALIWWRRARRDPTDLDLAA